MHLEVNIGVFEPFLIAQHQNSWISSMNLTIFCWVAGKFKISNGILMYETAFPTNETQK